MSNYHFTIESMAQKVAQKGLEYGVFSSEQEGGLNKLAQNVKIFAFNAFTTLSLFYAFTGLVWFSPCRFMSSYILWQMRNFVEKDLDRKSGQDVIDRVTLAGKAVGSLMKSAVPDSTSIIDSVAESINTTVRDGIYFEDICLYKNFK